jgi:hypothetical protein
MNWLKKFFGWGKEEERRGVVHKAFHLAPFASRAGILALEKIVEAAAPEDLDDLFPVTHLFANGVCSREMFMPKGTIVVSRVHKEDCINVLSEGEVAVLSEEGEVRLTAPYKFVSKAGTKRVIVAYTDTVWSNFIRTDETDPEKILDVMTFATFEEFDNYQLRLEN